ncbi:hypothetical protein AM571_PB00161 (plasmid) [Rhizobium etli 8C-3]|uniref:Uncharacterized protein n=1 Tax=Rhizobium etli 8C-3 TaxID=538025 RepID=A0A1L5PBE8_RHIET|nr:hypothetical protein IE4803_PB00229 [Rhizobium etli bv. phaseoli str. IE4803]APO77452.1 hypothetical protein AM571_PB00161 [Rhizobium etli 8C-3]ARQ60674.1 hypothetical protein Kim5_PA00203 [Rhizobium sp. Kim5]
MNGDHQRPDIWESVAKRWLAAGNNSVGVPYITMIDLRTINLGDFDCVEFTARTGRDKSIALSACR